jgi:hypothetical protein
VPSPRCADAARSYGYRSIEAFVEAVAAVRAGATPDAAAAEHGLASLADTVGVTAVMHAGRFVSPRWIELSGVNETADACASMSLDAGGRAVRIEYGDDGEAAALQLA